MKKEGTVALVVKYSNDVPVLLDALSDDHEILVLESGVRQGSPDPLALVYDMRKRQSEEEEEFGDYVEELLTQPFLQQELKTQGIQWLKSKIKIEQYQKCEQEATKVIANFAYKLFRDDPKRVEFTLHGPTAQVRIKIFELQCSESNMAKAA